MKTTNSRSLALLVLLLLAGCGLGDSEAGVDENLFLLHALQNTYTRWPDRLGDPDRIADWLARTRLRIAEIRASVRTSEIDPGVVVLYEDCSRFLDAYGSYLENLGVIEQPIQARESAGRAWPIPHALAGSRARAGARSAGGLNGVSWAGVQPAIFRGLEDAHAGSEIGRGDDASINAEMRRLRETWLQTKLNAEEIATKLTEKHGWIPGEAGFDDFKATTKDDLMRRRPRDPFVLLRFAMRVGEGDTPAGILDKARTCVAAADLVPQGSVYDLFRADFLKEAARLGARATVMELQPFSYSLGPAPSGQEAVRFAELYLAANPDDPSREGHLLLSHALASIGGYDDAVREANVVLQQWDDNAAFCYHYTKLMSLTNSPDLAGDWLAHAYRAGFHDIDFVRSDADLASYRADRPQQFDKLTRVKWGFRVVRDRLLDDIVLTNESPFELTNMHADLFIRQGRQVWEPSVRLDSLKPGESYKALDLLKVPAGRYDEATGVLFCDQDP